MQDFAGSSQCDLDVVLSLAVKIRLYLIYTETGSCTRAGDCIPLERPAVRSAFASECIIKPSARPRYAKVYYGGRAICRAATTKTFRSFVDQPAAQRKVNKKRRAAPRKRRARVERMEINRFQKRELLPCRSRFNRKTQTIIRFLTRARRRYSGRAARRRSRSPLIWPYSA